MSKKALETKDNSPKRRARRRGVGKPRGLPASWWNSKRDPELRELWASPRMF